MKVCKMGLESIWIDHAQGDVRLCAWTGYDLGNLIDHTIEELWHGEKAEVFRQSMLDGSYRFCKCQTCPYLANDTLDEVLVEYYVPKYPKYCSLSYEEQCNYVCVFCRKEPYKIREWETDHIRKIEQEIQKFIGQLDTISSNGVGELFCSHHILNLLGSIQEDRTLNVVLESNGSLFTPQNWERIKNLERYNLSVYITLYSFENTTYQFLTGTKLSVNRVIENLHFIQSLRDKNIINYFEIATVVAERNFREMPGYVERCLSEFHPDRIRLRSFIPYNVDHKAIEWFYDIRNPYHPYYNEFLHVMKNPIFSHPKVWKWQGNMVSDIGKHPYFLEHEKLELIGRMVGKDHFESKLKQWLNRHFIQSFSLYGFSYGCKCFLRMINGLREKLDKIYDSNGKTKETYCGTTILCPEQDEIKCDAIIITSVYFEEIQNRLKDLNYKGIVITLTELLNELEHCEWEDSCE